MTFKKGSTFRSYTILTLLSVLFYFSCSESTVTPDDSQLGLEYFPVEIGQFRVYDVDEIIYQISGNDTLNYELRESIVDSFENLEGALTYTVHREKKFDEVSGWQLDSVWTVRKNNTTLVSVENNVPIIKMVFPVENSTSWDSNQLNAGNQKLFFYNIDVEDMVVSADTLTDLVQVVQSEVDENIVNRDERFEIYAPNIGLIMKSGITLTFCTVDCPDQKTIVSGRFIDQVLTSYGSQ